MSVLTMGSAQWCLYLHHYFSAALILQFRPYPLDGQVDIWEPRGNLRNEPVLLATSHEVYDGHER
jgi:hypothetical protein